MLLPKLNQFFEIPRRNRQYMAHTRHANVARPDGIPSVSQGDSAVHSKIDDHLSLCIETMHMAGLMVHRVGGKSDAVETNGAHAFPILTQAGWVVEQRELGNGCSLDRVALEIETKSIFRRLAASRQISKITGIIIGRRPVVFWIRRFKSARTFSLTIP